MESNVSQSSLDATGPYPETVESRPHPSIFKIRYSAGNPILAEVFPVFCSLQILWSKLCAHFPSLQWVLNALPTSHSFVWSPFFVDNYKLLSFSFSGRSVDFNCVRPLIASVSLNKLANNAWLAGAD
jgi:hypothetical protein